MSVSSSKFGQSNQTLAREVDHLLTEARSLGATEGPQRLETICSQYDQLSTNVAYQWLDPGAFQREVEEAQTHGVGVEFIHFFRNVFSLAPLIVTWAALFSAVNAYQRDLITFPADKTASFLELWQSGFNGTTRMTFTVAAGLDVVFLLLFLVFILLTHHIDRRAHSLSIKFAQKLQSLTEDLMKVISSDGVTHIVDQSGIDNVADAVQKVVQKAVDVSTKIAMTAEQSIRQVADASTKAITDSNSRMEDVFKRQIDPLIGAFRTDMAVLQKELGNYQGRLNDLTNASQQVASASQQLANASSTLTANAERYTTIGQDIKTQIAALNTTQQDVLSQIKTISGSISTAAGNMITATTNMTAATRAVQGVATQLNTGMQTTIHTMTTNVDRATQSLAQVGPQLNQASQYLNNAAMSFASVKGKPRGISGFLARIFG